MVDAGQIERHPMPGPDVLHAFTQGLDATDAGLQLARAHHHVVAHGERTVA